ncbi:hypothetical protein AVEN_209795-1 [Araneus ventricosus]|uniref:Uncharacterized protein n=1 Tax=Araneus ventricosus TaxID=182803 RepID=A0A4Y2QJP9_ARAVE|nr:hypothetical protein AVEN_209795-1 [Araneus ventricosus]
MNGSYPKSQLEDGGVDGNLNGEGSSKCQKVFASKRPGLISTDALLLRARQHRAFFMNDLIQRFRWGLLEHPSYSLELGQLIFIFMDRCLHFRIDAEVQQAVLTQLQDIEDDFFHARFDTLLHRLSKCFEKKCDYMDNYFL